MIKNEYINDFINGDLVIQIYNEQEYLQFMNLLKLENIDIENPSDYPIDEDYYDPEYTYFFMEHPETKYMNANKSFRNIQKYNNPLIKLIPFSEINKHISIDRFHLFQNVSKEKLNDIYIDYKFSQSNGTRCEQLVPFAESFIASCKANDLMPLCIALDIVKDQFFEEIAERTFGKIKTDIHIDKGMDYEI